MTRRNQVLTAAAILIAGALGIVFVARSRSNGAASPRLPQATKDMGGTPGMPGMPGMAMPSNGTVALTAGQIRELGVIFGTVEMRPITADVRASGVVAVDETRLAEVAPKFGGFVERLYANATGQSVRKGQALLDVYSPDLIAAQQELLLATDVQRNIGTSSVPGVPATRPDLVAAAKRRLALLDISDAQIEDILRTGHPRRTLSVYSPASGVVIAKRVVEGQSIMAGQSLYTIADLGVVWIEIQLREADAVAAPLGTAADVDITGLPGRIIKGRVSYIYPTVDSTTRTIRARIIANNAEGFLKPGMYAAVRLRANSRTTLTVPASAVLRTGTRNVVFVEMTKGQLMPMEIEIGWTGAAYIEVLAGLEPGQRVVTSAQFLLDSESNLAEVMRSMIGQMGR
jgi:multidrug efflux pump subunit AcrA (membrane-fusion protein)